MTHAERIGVRAELDDGTKERLSRDRRPSGFNIFVDDLSAQACVPTHRKSHS